MIFYNQVYQYVNDEKENRIRVIEVDNQIVYYVELNGDTAMPKKIGLKTLEDEIEEGILLAVSDPYFMSHDDRNLTPKQIEKRDEDWKVINSSWEELKWQLLEKKTRDLTFDEIAEKFNLKKLKVKRLFTRFWQRGLNKNALLPDYNKSGGKGKERDLSGANKVGRPRKYALNNDLNEGINITNDVKKQFAHVIKQYYRKKEQITLTETYEFLLRDFYSNKYVEDGEVKYSIWDISRIPSYNQFYYWFKKYEDPQLDISMRKSKKEFELKHRPILSNSTQETDGPGTRFQVDATIADIYLVSSFNRSLIIGRPVVYGIIDVYSRLFTGVYVGLEGPSWIGAMMALDNMITDKVAFCAEHDIYINDSQWPAKHLPEIIIADRGEFEGYSVTSLINNFNIKIENTSAYRGDLKGVIERQFGTINGKIKRKAPGAIQKEYRERGDRDYRLDATLNLKEFTKIVIHLMLQHNQKIIDKYPLEKAMIEDGLVATPLNLWSWGIANKKGRLQVTNDKNIYRLNILPRGKARITRAGIKFKGLSYGSDKAINEQWYVKLRSTSIEVAYDPRDMNQIYIPSNDGKSFDICFLLDTSEQYKGNTLDEIEFYQEYLEELKAEQFVEQKNNSINTDATIEDIIKKAKSEKKKQPKPTSKTEQVRNIKVNRQAEKALQREEEKFDLVDREAKMNQQPTQILEFPKIKEESPKKSSSGIMSKLKRKRDEQFGEDE